MINKLLCWIKKMLLVPHNDNNKYISFIVVQMLKIKTAGFSFKIKTVKSYTTIIGEIIKNVRCFKKDIQEIESKTFIYNSRITKVIIPNTVKHIRLDAFYGCYDLQEIVLNSVLRIGDYAFYYCESLKKIKIPNTVTSIGIYAFCGCINIKKIIIPYSIIHIERGAFYGCPSLKEIKLPRFLENIDFFLNNKNTKIIRY